MVVTYQTQGKGIVKLWTKNSLRRKLSTTGIRGRMNKILRLYSEFAFSERKMSKTSNSVSGGMVLKWNVKEAIEVIIKG